VPTEKAVAEMPAAMLSGKVKGLLAELFSSLIIEEAVTCMKEISDNGGDMEVAVVEVFSIALDSIGTKWELLSDLLSTAASKGILPQDVLTAGVKRLLEGLSDLAMDAPHAPKQVGTVLGNLVAAGSIDLQEIAFLIRTADPEALPPGQETMLVEDGKAAEVIAALMLAVADKKDEAAARAAWQASGAEWKAFLAEMDRVSEESVSKLAQKFNVAEIVI